MFRIQRLANGKTNFRLIGRMNAENVPELQAQLDEEEEDRQVILDLEDLTLVDRDAVRFLGHCEVEGIQLTNCPAYIREWIERERSACRIRVRPKHSATVEAHGTGE
jgi:ABC-type transporter Mla MlaB component